jgi:hypothetical protein
MPMTKHVSDVSVITLYATIHVEASHIPNLEDENAVDNDTTAGNTTNNQRSTTNDNAAYRDDATNNAANNQHVAGRTTNKYSKLQRFNGRKRKRAQRRKFISRTFLK